MEMSSNGYQNTLEYLHGTDANSSAEHEAAVIDGTACSPDTTSICVQGQCIKAGCDLQIGSSKKLDKCGVCGGDGLSCRKISGSYNKVIQGYSDIVTIPLGATNIDIKQRSHKGIKHDGNYLAVKRENGEYILNGNFSVSTVEQDIPARGAVLKYSGSDTTLERIQSFRQLREAVTVQLLSTAREASLPKVKYTFFIPKGVSFGRPKDRKMWVHAIHPFGVPQWVLGDWSECSRSCGSGWSRRSVDCKDDAGFYSSVCDKGLRPADIRPCADLPCPMWQTGPWSSCSRTCGRGERRRSTVCVDYTGKPVEEEKCDPTKQPMPVSGESTWLKEPMSELQEEVRGEAFTRRSCASEGRLPVACVSRAGTVCSYCSVIVMEIRDSEDSEPMKPRAQAKSCELEHGEEEIQEFNVP
ncbi:hypothetical protein P4O66_003122 [Electrophorus voltai]|uniref:Uncharacterized protein n=1 Tax=Electrophorus voltai TaxID=2609070 RepID=A0AAD8YRG1_9TELE|nr:hypothetical protein P4O66_003122 [Electrophorus voltai]